MLIRQFSITRKESILLSALFAVGFALIGTSIDAAHFSTLLLFLFIVLTGLSLCHKTWCSVADLKLRILGFFWLIKLSLTLALLYAGWIPQLDPGSLSWGYDPQRFYQESYDLLLNDWTPTANLNYQGILYYYAVIFYFFDHNPVIPAMVNAFVTLLGSLFLIRCFYAFAPRRSAKNWLISALLLVPEVLWFDVMTSRETLMASLVITAILVPGRYLIGINKLSLMGTLIVFVLTSVGILAIRTSMMIPVVVSIAVMVLILKSRRRTRSIFKLGLVGMGIAVLFAGPLLQQITGGYEFNYLRVLNQLQSFENNVASQMEWGDSSIGLLLAPSNFWQAIAFTPPRMLLYLVAPLPKVEISLIDLLDGSWEAWQLLMTLPTSILILVGFPYVLAQTAQAWNERYRFPAALIIPIAFWTNFIAVAGGNIIIHERYRLMFTLLLFACMGLGHSQCDLSVVKRWAVLWFVFLAGASLFYIIYKLV